MRPRQILALPPPTAGVGARETRPGELGMWVFIGSEMLFFGGLLLSYAWGRANDAQGFAAASRQTHVVLGTLNTAILLGSSLLVALAALAMQAAKDPTPGAAAARAQMRKLAARLLLGAASAGVVFLAIKGVEYRAEWREHLVPGPAFSLAGEAGPAGAQLFFVFYWLATALHALHVLAGAGWLALLSRALARERPWATAEATHAAGLYWHFVDAVWVLLYPLIYLVARHP